MATPSLRLEGTLRDRTAEHLANLILSGEWAAGEYLPSEVELIRRLGVSRTAYREALSRLEAQGLIEVRHGVGTRVTDRTREVAADSLALMVRRGGVMTLQVMADARQAPAWPDTLYRELLPVVMQSRPVQLIPYYAWANRGVSQMMVWLPLSHH